MTEWDQEMTGKVSARLKGSSTESLTIYSGFHSARTNNPSSTAEGHRAGMPLSQPRSDRACAEMELIKS